MTDTLKLKGAIVAAGYTQKNVAELLKLSAYGIWKKIHNKAEFKASEIAKLCDILKIVDKQAIFFA